MVEAIVELTCLGTAAAEGIPGIFCEYALCREVAQHGGKDMRARSQAILDDGLLMDFPPGSCLHMVRDGVSLPGIRNLLITHTHSDHFIRRSLTTAGAVLTMLKASWPCMAMTRSSAWQITT